MRDFVLDASVALAWYLPESFSPAAQEWRQRMLAGERFFVPPLHFLEVANGLRTQVRRGDLDAPTAERFYRHHLSGPLVQRQSPLEDVLTRALSSGATAYDAAYIELTLQLDARLVTAEKPTRPWVAALGDRVISLVPQTS